MTSRYARRKFPLGQNEWLQCWCRTFEHNGVMFAVLRDDDAELSKGALTVRFEYVANLYRVELLMKGWNGPVRYFHERPEWSNDVVHFPAQIREVQMIEREGQYCYSKWVPVPEEELTVITEGAKAQG